MAHTAGMDVPGQLVATVYKQTEGNPFFVTEITRLLVTEGQIEHPIGQTSQTRVIGVIYADGAAEADGALAALQARMDASVFNAALAAAQAMTLEQSIAEATAAERIYLA
jgi:predicted ATPase